MGRAQRRPVTFGCCPPSSSSAAGETTGKCDGLLAVSEELSEKQFHNATEDWTCHALIIGEGHWVRLCAPAVDEQDVVPLFVRQSSCRSEWLNSCECGEERAGLGCAGQKLNGNKHHCITASLHRFFLHCAGGPCCCPVSLFLPSRLERPCRF
jgi:hypothetical protein